MKNHTQLITRLLADHIVVTLAERYESLGRRSFARRSYRIDSEMEQIRQEIGFYTCAPESEAEGILVALARAARPDNGLTLPKDSGLERRALGEYRPGLAPIPAPVRKHAPAADWQPSRQMAAAA